MDNIEKMGQHGSESILKRDKQDKRRGRGRKKNEAYLWR